MVAHVTVNLHGIQCKRICGWLHPAMGQGTIDHQLPEHLKCVASFAQYDAQNQRQFYRDTCAQHQQHVAQYHVLQTLY